jgi:hypothetical protein
VAAFVLPQGAIFTYKLQLADGSVGEAAYLSTVKVGGSSPSAAAGPRGRRADSNVCGKPCFAGPLGGLGSSLWARSYSSRDRYESCILAVKRLAAA